MRGGAQNARICCRDLNFTEFSGNDTIGGVRARHISPEKAPQNADVAQLVEQLIRNQQVVSSSLTVGSILVLPCCGA